MCLKLGNENPKNLSLGRTTLCLCIYLPVTSKYTISIYVAKNTKRPARTTYRAILLVSCDWFTFDYFSYLVLTSFLVYLLPIYCLCRNNYYYCINVGLFWNNCTEVRFQLLRIHDNNITDLKQKTLLLSYLVLLCILILLLNYRKIF